MLKLIASGAAAAALLFASAPADASVRKCDGKTYGGIDPQGFPVVSKLKAIDLPRLTDGYAPRCLVAESLAGAVQRRNGAEGRYRIHGARWNGGTWRVRYRVDGNVAKYTGRKAGQRITFLGGS